MSGGGMGYRVGGGFNILDLLCKDGAGSFFISSILKWREMSDWGGRGGAVRRGDWGYGAREEMRYCLSVSDSCQAAVWAVWAGMERGKMRSSPGEAVEVVELLCTKVGLYYYFW